MIGTTNSEIQPGQWFQKNRHVWEVVDCVSVNGIPHAKLSKVGDPTERKLLSVRTLCRGYGFAPA